MLKSLSLIDQMYIYIVHLVRGTLYILHNRYWDEVETLFLNPQRGSPVTNFQYRTESKSIYLFLI